MTSETDELSRSDLRMIEQAVRHNWDIPEDAMSFLPRKMLQIAAKSKNERNAIAATRVLAEIVKQSQPPEAQLHLHSHGKAATVKPTEGMTFDERQEHIRIRIDRLARLSN